MNMKFFIASSLLITSFSSFAVSLDEDKCLARWEKLIDEIDIQTALSIPNNLLFKCDNELKEAVKVELMKGQKNTTYGQATKFMYKYLDNHDGYLCSAYTPDECNYMGKPEDKNDDRKAFTINCEHTWPKSLGAKEYPMKSDLHHLYPTEKNVNNHRANKPFCNVETVFEEFGPSKIGLAKGSTEECFEPPKEHKGNVARSMLYFAVRYDYTLTRQEENLYRSWSKLDPVNKQDIKRNDEIEKFQGNRNVFVDHPELIDLIADF